MSGRGYGCDYSARGSVAATARHRGSAICICRRQFFRQPDALRAQHCRRTNEPFAAESSNRDIYPNHLFYFALFCFNHDLHLLPFVISGLRLFTDLKCYTHILLCECNILKLKTSVSKVDSSNHSYQRKQAFETNET